MLLGIAILAIASIGIWRHQYLKTMNAEPIKIYKDTPIEPNTLPKKTVVNKGKDIKSTPLDIETLPKDTSTNSDNPDIGIVPRETTQPNDNNLTHEKTDKTSNPSVHHIFSDIVVENLPPKAVAALKDYEEVQLAIPELNEELKPLLKARPVDFDAIDVINGKKDVLNERRMNALEILSKYSKQAADKLQATIIRGKAAEKVVQEYDENPDMSTEDLIRRMEELTK